MAMRKTPAVFSLVTRSAGSRRRAAISSPRDWISGPSARTALMISVALSARGFGVPSWVIVIVICDGELGEKNGEHGVSQHGISALKELHDLLYLCVRP